MDTLLTRQKEIIHAIERICINFGKDGPGRKTEEYIQTRLSSLDELWKEFEQNHVDLIAFNDVSSEYFTKNIYGGMVEYYEKERKVISTYQINYQRVGQSKEGKATDNSRPQFEVPTGSLENRGTASCGPVEELLSQQRTNFRAFARITNRINFDSMIEKWEIEDQLRDLQYRWRVIDELHLRIDNMLQGQDVNYDAEFGKFEDEYNNIRKQLNRKLSSSAHLQQSTPKVEIPTFTGKYAHWPTFFDLFTETIHNNTGLSKSQKMQHLKSKVKGEAERLIQHLQISSENYNTAWEVLVHRYNNPHALFSNQIETFLNQPAVHKQTSFELKRLHDTTMECIYAIHNLGIDTTTWDPLLVHLIAKKLDNDTYKDYKEARKSPRDLPSFDELMQFIESKFTALEPINKRDKHVSDTNSNMVPQPHYAPKVSYSNRKFQRNYQSAPTYTPQCPLCHGTHDLFKCKRFLNLTSECKLKTIAKQQICQNCLFKHYDKPCISKRRCKYCEGEHNSIIHNAIMEVQSPAIKCSSSAANQLPNNVTETKSPTDKQHNVGHVAAEDEEILLTTLSLKVKAADNTYITLRALLDQGSQITLISENAAQLLGLQRHRFQASVSGIGASSKQSKGIITLECESIYEDYHFSTQALIISRVINDLPNASFKKRSWPHLQNIKLADPEYNISKPIDLLLDASVYSEIIMNGLIKGSPLAPIAQQTKLGWILSGNVKTFNCNVVINQTDDISKFWEVEDINQSSSTMTEPEKYCEEFYQATTRRLDSGRYEVALPMKPGFEENLGASRSKAVIQFKQLEKRMARNESLSTTYKKFINEYEQLQHMRLADPLTSQLTSPCYLPHHGVLKLDSATTALRVVFNASAKTSSGYSLNDLMECGPNLQQDLQGLILKWRTHKYVVTADIEKMFRQFLIREADQHLQTIVWRNSTEESLREYHLTTVTYGTKAAPFLAMRTLRQIARDNESQFPLAAAALENCFYTDDLMTGYDSLEQVKELQRQLIQVLNGAGLNLRKWSSNNPELIKNLPSNQLNTPFDFKDTESRKTLGLQWNPASDAFTFINRIESQEGQGDHTKRKLLSDISKIYDPLGWLSPITIKAKILFQKTWLADMKWDEELPADILNEWRCLRDDLKNIENFSISRYLGNKETYQLHGFCDASEKAYACAVYAVTNNDKGEYTSRLVAAKTKVAPQNKKISLPRLELLGSLLLAQLMKKITECLSAQHITINAWTDSMVVLGWLHGDISRWKQFVANRVRQIIDIIPASQWRHVKSDENAADFFVCLATKAVHLELVSDLSTPAFLAAFRRLCARRGIPQHMYSDNGTNFVGAARVLQQEYKAILKALDTNCLKTINDMGVSWHFNVPANPTAGGLWESAVKSMKFHLKRVLGEQKLTYEEFITLLHQIEACMNSRPLCHLTEDPQDEYLTPGHFLVGDSLISRPQTDSEHINLPKRWQLVQNMNKYFWKKWSGEYLQQLQVRSKWRTPSKNIEVDDIVIIQEDNLPPGKWALGRVHEVYPGKDGFVRAVSLKTQNKIIKRPIKKLILLPTHEDNEEAIKDVAISSRFKTKGKGEDSLTALAT
ncbi:uncharacterized protein [Choristoneura fumiferana]|uniref:uncharacterized protein n=1 Tax=Choristoneura fumiferana TaxID=7141 RepID=UPI003D15B555